MKRRGGEAHRAGRAVVYMEKGKLVHVRMLPDPSNQVSDLLTFTRSFRRRYLIGGWIPGLVQFPRNGVPLSAKRLHATAGTQRYDGAI